MDSTADLESLRVRVLPTDHSRSASRSGERPVHKTAHELHASPLRVAIPFQRETDVLVQIIGRGPAGTFIATRCYHVAGVVRDSVMLVRLDQTIDDIDNDGFSPTPSALCSDPDGAGGMVACDFACADSVAADCRGCVGTDCPADPVDQNAQIYPGAPEFCEDGVDQDCNGADTMCGDHDGDGSSACRTSTSSGVCDCDDQDASRHPGADDLCGDGIDQNCDGRDQACDRDNDGYVADIEVGGAPDCDDTNPGINPGAAEVCTPDGALAVDENCNGVTDELSSCLRPDLDLDGVDACMGSSSEDCDINDCDPGINPNAPEVCGNTIDENGDGVAADCSANDQDHDGFASIEVGGTDCNDADPNIHPEAGDRCGDTIDQNCDTADTACAGDTDGDGYVGLDDCAEGDATVHASAASDPCNGVNDDCDLTEDEVLASMADRGCVLTGRDTGQLRAEIRFNTILHCGACRNACNSGSTLLADACVANPSMDGALTCDCAGDSAIRACAGTRADTCCPGAGCADLDTSMTNCGGCANACDPLRADACTDGRCTCGAGLACEGSSICCGGVCVNPSNDLANCGGCGNECTAADVPNATFRCAMGECAIDECASGFDDCTSAPGCETSLNSSAHCGSCGNVCGTGSTCVMGVCGPNSCPTGQADCDGAGTGGCVMLNTLTNCNGCGTPCTVSHGTGSCSSGTCMVADCDPGFEDCDSMASTGCEAEVETDPMHCGASCAACNNADVHGIAECREGVCEAQAGSCFPGYIDCDASMPGCEMVNMSNACNECGEACTMSTVNGTPSCEGGTCHAIDCAPGFLDCDEMSGTITCEAESLMTDCNECGAPCTAAMVHGTPSCEGGTCHATSCDGAMGYMDCDMSSEVECRSTLTLTDCGGCGIACTAFANGTASCATGTCEHACSSGFGDCDGMEANGCEAATTDTACGSSCVDCTTAGELCCAVMMGASTSYECRASCS